MNKIFSVELSGGNDRYCELDLPATAYELLDALDKLRLEDGEAMRLEVCDYYDFAYLAPFLSESCNLYELNALAEKLSGLDEVQRTSFAGLLKMEIAKRDGDILMPKLIDLVHSVDCCHVVADALNDSQLGRFYADNGFIPITDQVPDSLYELLDFEALGRKMREGECGVFVERDVYGCSGYVTQNSDLVEAYKDMDLKPRNPPYTILLELTKGWFDDPHYDSDKTVQLWCPPNPRSLENALNELGAASWSEVAFRCLDCRAPSLIDAVSNADNLAMVNRFARRLDIIAPGDLPAYKALLAAAQCQDLQDAMTLADSLDSYIFSPRFSSSIEVAKGELGSIMHESDAELLLPHVNLYGYGEALIQHNHGELTEYGLIERQDGQPIQSMKEQPIQGGMEMM